MKEDKDTEIRMLSAKLGNLEVQNAEYRQIVRELSDKLSLYENKYGRYSGRLEISQTKNNSVLFPSEFNVFEVNDMHVHSTTVLL